ncbi:MAG: DNA polymerase IV [Gemmatimonadetes bacterium]|nr:DNA polymerase IV [Gemmatimonadota bacterium]
MPHRILLADADAFYVAVARLVDPEGAGRTPLLIVGGSAEHRGVVTSASYEARKFGVHSAMPMARAVRLCPDALVVPVPMEACGRKAREIRAALEQFTPVVEQASSDEFYLDMTGTEKLYHDEPLAQTAHRMRETVRLATGLTVSIGGGTSRVVAKLAAGVAKPRTLAHTGRSDGQTVRRSATGVDRPTVRPSDHPLPGTGVYVVEPGSEIDFMRQFSLADIHGVGPKFQERLAKLGLRTVDDALGRDLATLTGWLGKRAANWLYQRIRGIDEAVVAAHAGAKSISRDDTFSRDLDDDSALDEKLLWLVDRATSDLRAGGLLARTVTVRLRDADFTDRQASHTLSRPISSDRAVLTEARKLLARLRAARRVPARLLGVALSNLLAGEVPAQLSLLEPETQGSEDTPKDRAIAQAIDELRERFGRDAIARGRTPD